MNLFEQWDYKTVLKLRIQAKRETCPAFTLGKMAESLDLEPSYVSRVINSDRHHFSEDQLFRVLTRLGFRAVEREYALLLRTHQTTSLGERKTDLERQIRVRQRTRCYGDFRKMHADLEKMAGTIREWIEDP